MLKSTQTSITPVRPIKKKLMNDCQPTVDAEREGQNDEPEEGTVMPWAVLSQMNRMHESQEDKLWRRIKPILSIFKALRPINQTRFLTALWWTSSRVGAELVMFKFMMTVIMIKTPPKEIGLFWRHQDEDWAGDSVMGAATNSCRRWFCHSWRQIWQTGEDLQLSFSTIIQQMSMTKRPTRYVQPLNMLEPLTCKGSIVATAKGIEAIHFGSTMMELFGSKFDFFRIFWQDHCKIHNCGKTNWLVAPNQHPMPKKREDVGVL